MSRATLRPAATLTSVALSLALVAGCGGSAGKKEGTVTADSYVGSVCSSVASWLNGIQSQAAKLQSGIGSTTSPQQGKAVLESFVNLSAADTESAVSALRGAGVPNVPNGRRVANTLLSAFERAKGELQALRAKVAALPANDAAALHAAVTRLGSEVQAVPLHLGTGLGSTNSPELNKAAAESRACKSVGGRAAAS